MQRSGWPIRLTGGVPLQRMAAGRSEEYPGNTSPAREMFSQPVSPVRRSPAAGAVSLLLHGAVAGLAIASAGVVSTRPPVEARLVFVASLKAPVVPPTSVEPLRMTPVARSKPVEPRDVEPPLSLPEPAASRPEPVEPEPLPEPVLPKPEPPMVKMGTFDGVAAEVREPAPVGEVRTAGFDAQAARAPDMRLQATALGRFSDIEHTTDPRPGTDRALGAVASAGFGGKQVHVSRVSSRAAAAAGFGSTTVDPREPARQAVEPVRSGAFITIQAPAPRAARADPRQVDRPVEVVFKPVPDYSEEGRARKIEGEVSLEVEFTADGSVRVVRVLRGLGHGLDEAATRAARQIRFKPAISGGVPVDVRATVNIVFRLT